MPCEKRHGKLKGSGLPIGSGKGFVQNMLDNTLNVDTSVQSEAIGKTENTGKVSRSSNKTLALEETDPAEKETG